MPRPRSAAPQTRGAGHAPPAGLSGMSGSSASDPPVSSPSSPGAGPPGRVLPSLASHPFFGAARCRSFLAIMSRIIRSTAASYSSQLDTPNSSNGCGAAAGSGSGPFPAGRPRWRSIVMNSRKNHPAASRAVRSSSERSWRRMVKAASANPSRTTSRRAALRAACHRCGSASAHPRTVAASAPSLRAACSHVEPPARSSAACRSVSSGGGEAAGNMAGDGVRGGRAAEVPETCLCVQCVPPRGCQPDSGGFRHAGPGGAAGSRVGGIGRVERSKARRVLSPEGRLGQPRPKAWVPGSGECRSPVGASHRPA